MSGADAGLWLVVFAAFLALTLGVTVWLRWPQRKRWRRRRR